MKIKTYALQALLGGIGALKHERFEPPVNSNVLLEADGKLLTGTASSSGEVISICVPCEGQLKTTLPVAAINIISQIPGDDVDTVEISAIESKIQFDWGGGNSTRFNNVDPDELWGYEHIDGTIIATAPTEFIRDAMEQTFYARGTESSSLILDGIHFESSDDGVLVVEAADGYRMARAFVDNNIVDGDDFSFVVPSKSAATIMRFLKSTSGDVEVRVNDTAVEFRVDNISYHSILLEGNYPDLDVLIRKSQTSIVADNKRLTSAVKAAGVVSNTDYNRVTLKIKDDSIKITASSDDLGDSAAAVKGRDGTGDELESKFNKQYLDSAIRQFSGGITITGDTNQPLTLSDTTQLHIIMPQVVKK